MAFCHVLGFCQWGVPQICHELCLHQGIYSPSLQRCWTWYPWFMRYILFSRYPALQCVLENLNLSVPVHISVQTLGSNGLTSEAVHVIYGTPDETDNLWLSYHSKGTFIFKHFESKFLFLTKFKCLISSLLTLPFVCCNSKLLVHNYNPYIITDCSEEMKVKIDSLFVSFNKGLSDLI